MKSRTTILGLSAAIFTVLSFYSVSPSVAADVPPLEERAAWFRHDRFGLFVHWGVYSTIGRGEWVQDTGKIPLAEYIKLYPKFNPEDFDAAEWVALAKSAGQKYIVITTKHHDGFCMFDSKLSDYTIMHTPFGRDICKELADECRKQGLKLGFYYSIMDWHHPDYTPVRPWEKGKRSTKGADFARYCKYMKGQVRELMSNYGPIVALWFDGGWEHKSDEDKKAFKDIIAVARQLQPNILVNDRAGIGGDYKTPEQRIPATGIVDKEGRPAMWEACMTMTTGHGSFAPTAWWGYDAHEKIFKPTEELLHKLIDITSKGGNFLLNVGPEPSGKIRPKETERLEAVGRWMDKYSESIYGTTASPFRLLPFFGRVTQKGKRLYVHIFDWPKDGKLVLPGLESMPAKAAVLGRPDAKLGMKRNNRDGIDEVLLMLPKEASDPIASVIALDFDTRPVVKPLVIKPAKDGKLKLPAAFVEIRAKHGQRAKPVSKDGRTCVGNWSNPNDVAVWCFTMPKAGSYRVELDARAASEAVVGQRVEISVGKSKLVAKIAKVGIPVEGKLDIPAGAQELSVKLLDAKRTGPEIIDLFGLTLLPAEK